MSSNFPSRGLDKFVLRLPDGMRDRIGAAARSNRRTMTAEIVARLEMSFLQQGQQSGAPSPPLQSDHEDRLRTLEEIVEQMMTDEGALSNRIAIVEARLNRQSS